MPPTPPNVANLRHDVADFMVSVTLSPTFDDDRAAQLSSTLTERAAEWLVEHVSELRDFVADQLDADEADAVDVVIGPKPLIADTIARLEQRAIEGR